MDDKSTLPVPAPGTSADESQAPTIAPSSASMNEDDKLSGKGAGTTSETDAASRGENEKSATDTGAELQRQATSASQTGSKIEPSRTREDGVEYPKALELGLITLALCLSVFLMALDNSIIATAIPKITDQFQSIPDIGWYGSGKLATDAPMRQV